jgi:Lysine-specific metallo-endopeptidase
MKLAAPIRRHFRRPPQLQQQIGFFAKEGESPTFFQPSSEPRMKEDPSFFSAKEPEEQEPVVKAPEEEEPVKSKAPDEEEPVKSKAPEEEEPVKAKENEDEVKPIAAKCACGCGGAGTCVKSPASSAEREQAKAPANQTSAPSSSAANGGRYDCSPMQESTAASAASQAGSLTRRAQQVAGEVASAGDDPASATTSHYERWFGKIDARRARLVRDTFAAIASNLGGTLHFHCDAEKNVYAYVRSCGRKEIYLGKLFWSRAGGTGIDSRAGVILHEVAHDASSLVGDHSYGVAGAEDLAMQNPERAVRSADNYEYFAESL